MAKTYIAWPSCELIIVPYICYLGQVLSIKVLYRIDNNFNDYDRGLRFYAISTSIPHLSFSFMFTVNTSSLPDISLSSLTHKIMLRHYHLLMSRRNSDDGRSRGLLPIVGSRTNERRKLKEIF